MQILTSPPQALKALPAPSAVSSLSQSSEGEAETTLADQVQISSAFRAERDLTYAVGASLAQLPHVVTNIAGRSYGVPHVVGAALGGFMAAAGAKEMMTEETLHGRINGGVHFAVGAMTAVAPWAGPLSTPLYLASMTTLAAKAFVDRPGTVMGIAGKESVQMAKDVFGPVFSGPEQTATELAS